MTNMSSTAVPALQIRRSYSAPPERVFAAWTTPDIAMRFFSAGAVKCIDARMDVKTGGTYSITMLSPENGELKARGTYLEVKAPERLVMSWRWEEDDPAEEYDSLLTLEFNKQGTGTELLLTHEKLATIDSVARHKEGWTKITDLLEAVLEATG